MAQRKEFQVHLLNEAGKTKAMDIADAFTKLLDDIEQICGTEGREIALVRTHMELASFYAKKAMASQPLNHM